MDATSDRRERLTALAILAGAVLVAAWIAYRPTPPKLLIPSPPVTSEPTVADLTDAPMAPVEVVELPPLVSSPPAPPAPAPPVQQQTSTPPATPKVEAAPRPEPPPAPQHISAQPDPTPALKAAPVEPPPPKQVEPLRPEPVRKVEAPAIKTLKSQPPIVATALDLPKPLLHEEKGPEPDPPSPLKPSQPDEAELAAFREARDQAKAMEPLKPELLPKPAPPLEAATPVERLSRPPMPDIKPLAPEPPKTLTVKAEPAPAAKPHMQVPSLQSAPSLAAPQPTIAGGNVSEGRALLRILEKGSGPGIQIGWPGDANARDRLYRLLTQCFGMQVGVLDTDNKLYMAEGQPGEPSEFNTDRYSGFVRRPEGVMAADEQHEVTRLRGYHHIATAASIRVFPRRVDAFLISGLRQAVGEGYLGLKSIRAIYRVNGRRVTVDSILADGRAVAGIIDLSAVSSGCGE